jgi:hypothetical protein
VAANIVLRPTWEPDRVRQDLRVALAAHAGYAAAVLGGNPGVDADRARRARCICCPGLWPGSRRGCRAKRDLDVITNTKSLKPRHSGAKLGHCRGTNPMAPDAGPLEFAEGRLGRQGRPKAECGTMSDQVDLSLIARQQRQLLADMGTVRDDMGVMMAILQRLDGTVSGLVNEVRAMHTQHSRLGKRVAALEGQP